ncbi:MAG: GGDEF domain-containing protein, partial [Enterococcus aquimarinus]
GSECSLQEEIQKARYWQNQAQYDHLTQLYSRYELERQLNLLDQKTRQTNGCYTLIIIDIDCFKNINDTHGHLMGDYVLSQMGVAITNACRSSDITGRYGGDEFLIALQETTKEQALNIARRIQSELKNIPFPSGLKPSISGGIATSAEASEIQKLISLADERLYLAKKNGRSQISVAS